MITEEDINKLRSLSKKSECWRLFRKNLHDVLLDCKKNIEAVVIHIKEYRDDLCSYSSARAQSFIEIHSRHCFKSKNHRYTKICRIEFNDADAPLSEDTRAFILSACNKITANMHMICISDNNSGIYIKKKISSAHVSYNGNQILTLMYGDCYDIDMTRYIVSDSVLSLFRQQKYTHNDYIKMLYSCINYYPAIHKKNIEKLKAEYDKLDDIDKKIMDSKEDINTLPNVSDSDYNLCRSAKYNEHFGFNVFLHGLSEIYSVQISKYKKIFKIILRASNHDDLKIRFYDEKSFDAFNNILDAAYKYIRLIYQNNDGTLYASSKYIDSCNTSFRKHRSIDGHLVSALLFALHIADKNSDEAWEYYESYDNDYMFLLHDYLSNGARFAENLNKRLEAASDSDKLLAMINMY